MLPSREDAKKLIERVLSYSKAEDCLVTLGGRDSANTRFADNGVTTSGRNAGMVIDISSVIATRTGHYGTNETSEASLRAAVARSEELARFAPPDPEYMPALDPQKYPEIEAYDAVTASAAQEQLAPAVKNAVVQAKEKKLVTAGFFQRENRALALGNKRGNFAYTKATAVSYSVTARTLDGTGSGWASTEGFRLKDIDPSAATRTAITKGLMSAKPRRLEPGKYTVILEPAAVSVMMSYFLRPAFDARAAEEGRSFMTRKGGGTRLGEKLFSEKVTIRSDAFDQRNPGAPWSGEIQTQLTGVGQFFFANLLGASDSYLPSAKITWVEKGIVKNLAYSRHWAEKRGAQPTPLPTENAIIEGENHSLDDLIRSTDRGLLVTHFFYIRYVNPQTIQLTGLTRDGLFMIDKGQIAYPVMNFRWNESAPNVLANVEMMASPVLVDGRLVPAMKVRNFNFSSVSDAV